MINWDISIHLGAIASADVHYGSCANWPPLFSFLLFIYLFGCLGLSRGMRALHCHVQDLSCGMRDLVPWPGIHPRPPALGAWVLTAGSPGKSLTPASSNSNFLFASSMTKPQGIQGKPSTAFWEGNLASLSHWRPFCVLAGLPSEVRCSPALAKAISTLLGRAGDYCVLNNFVLQWRNMDDQKEENPLLAPSWSPTCKPLSHFQYPHTWLSGKGAALQNTQAAFTTWHYVLNMFSYRYIVFCYVIA